jgi:hypothetical protein
MHRSGRLTLIKTTMCVVPVYTIISIGLPGWLLKALQKIVRAFLWGGTETIQSGKCLVHGSKAIAPRRLGGDGSETS